jgi:hypothetical protein
MAGGFVDLVVPSRHSRRLMLAGLQRMSLLALLMLVAQYALGIVLNLYVAVPAADAHAGIMQEIVNGPLTLTLHALLGLGLVGTAIVLLVRAVIVGDRRFAVLAAGGLTAIGGAFAAGEIFVRNGQQFASAAMAILTAVALLCYIGTLTLASAAYRQVARHRQRAMDSGDPNAADIDPWPPDYGSDDTDEESAWPPEYDDDSSPSWRSRLDDGLGSARRPGHDDGSGSSWRPRSANSRPPWRRSPNDPGLTWPPIQDDASRLARQPRSDDSAPPWRQDRDDPSPPWRQSSDESGPPWRQISGDSGLSWPLARDDSDPNWLPDHVLDDADLGLVWTPDADIPAPRPSWPDSGRSWSAPPGAR